MNGVGTTRCTDSVRTCTRAPRPPLRLCRAAVSAIGALVLCCACVAPATDSGAYRRNAINALDSAVSETRTAALAVQTHLEGRAAAPFTDTVVTASEEGLGPIEDSFGAVDPLTADDENLRQSVMSLLSDASDHLSAARIALRSDDTPAMRESIADLRHTADEMEEASQKLEEADASSVEVTGSDADERAAP